MDVRDRRRAKVTVGDHVNRFERSLASHKGGLGCLRVQKKSDADQEKGVEACTEQMKFNLAPSHRVHSDRSGLPRYAFTGVLCLSQNDMLNFLSIIFPVILVLCRPHQGAFLPLLRPAFPHDVHVSDDAPRLSRRRW